MYHATSSSRPRTTNTTNLTMASRKRRREEDDNGSEHGTVEIESANSSFRTEHNKRSRVAMAQAAGGSVFSDEEDYLLSDVEDPNNRDAAFDYSMRQDSSDDEQEDDELDEIRATQFVEKQLREYKENIPADCGVITQVYMRNFMCHPNLTINLGPLINFIIGHNGSGKSAILTALQICLGNKASGTNRAKSLKAMIKEGTEKAEVGVKIKNGGENAYKPDMYGNVIVVERHFSKAGSSGFKLKSEEGRIISTKKADLDDILDFFGLQMDNPINVLTQDLARSFLSNSTPAEKYRFFIRGTQLETLDGDYKIIEEQIDETESKLETREADLTELQRAAKEAERRKKQAESNDKLQEKIWDISRQHAWLQVQEQEELLKRYQEDVTKAESHVADAERVFEETSTLFDVEDGNVQAAQRGIEGQRGALEPVQETHDTAKAAFDANKEEILKHKVEQRTIKESFKRHKTEAERLEKDVEEERNRLNQAQGEVHTQRLDELQSLKGKANDAKQAYDHHAEGLAELEQASQDAQKLTQDAKAPMENANAQQAHARRQVDELQRDTGTKWAPYHPKMQQLCQAIDKETRWRVKPVGPMGLYVRLVKPEWGSVIESTFGGALSSFAVKSKDDQALLSNLAGRIGMPCNVVIFTGNAIDPTNQEPEGDIDTILRVLRIEADIVRSVLILNHAIEQTVLFSSQEEGYNYMYNNGRRRNVRATLTMGPRKGGAQRWEYTRTNDQKVGPVKPWEGHFRMQVDHEQQLRIRQENHEHARRAYQELEAKHRELRAAAEAAKQAKEAHMRESKRLKVEWQKAEDAVDAKQGEIDANQPQDGKLQELEKGLEEALAEQQQAKDSLDDSIQFLTTLDAKARTLKDTLDEATRELETIKTRIRKAEETLTHVELARRNALYEKNGAESNVKSAKTQLERVQGKVAEQEQQVTEFTAAASETSDRVRIEHGMTVDKLDMRLVRLKEDLKRQQAAQGGSKEELTRAWTKAQHEYEAASKQARAMKRTANVSVLLYIMSIHRLTLSQMLKTALTERQRRWGLFRKYISMRTRIQFHYLLSERSFRGRVILDHVNKTLEIGIEPDKSRASDTGRQAKTLSGGEKSFSTICLLLSIWEAMGSPIRCLDEFDVYMDSVNRAQSMSLMIQTARRAVGRQFILITPQSMNSVELGDDVSIHR
jgi:chromosome segregation ATPase